MSLPLERRRTLQELGLRALVKRRFGVEAADAAVARPFGGGAALVAGTRLAAVFADGPAGLGAAIVLADRHSVDHLYFFSEQNDADLARRATAFRLPTTVVSPDGDFEDLAPAPAPATTPMPLSLAASAARLHAAGLDVEWEHGVLTGEWLGLEVARATAAADGGGVIFEVGVGKHDREANRMLHPDGASDAFLDQAIAAVRERRRPDALPHPARDLAPDRWLRAVLTRMPGLAGLDELHPGPPPVARHDLPDRAIAPGWGRAGGVVIVACTVGVNPEAVVHAADARLQAAGWTDFPGSDAPATRLLVVVPAGDDHPLTRQLVALLRQPAEVVTVPGSWREAAP